jgi:serine/threonine protein kinase
MDKELFVDSSQTDETEFPVLLMDWVEGITLDKYLRENLDDQYALEMLAYRFSQLAQWLIPQPFAHGDLKPDNILVREDGTLVLVDYDGMYVPAMKGQKARELGSPDFRHPSRTEEDFDEHIDDFPLVSILLSLKAISINPKWLEEYGTSNHLLFSEKDYCNIQQCKLLKELFPSDVSELNVLVSLFMFAFDKMTLNGISISLLNQQSPKDYDDENLSLEVTKEDLENAWRDDYGVMYSKDRTRLLGAYGSYLPDYEIQKGTKVICNDSLNGFWDEIEGLMISGKIKIPSTVQYIGRNPFRGDYEIIECQSPYFIIEDEALYTSDKRTLISCFSKKTKFSIPDGVEKIGSFAFYDCNISQITIPKTVSYIGDNPFIDMNVLSEASLEIICNSPHYFVKNNSLYKANPQELISFLGETSYLFIEEGTEAIGAFAFFNKSPKSIYLPSSIRKMPKEALWGTAFSLKQLLIPPKTLNKFNELLPKYSEELLEVDVSYMTIDEHGAIYDDINKRILNGCDNNEYAICDGTTEIYKNAFSNCTSLTKIVIPISIKKIGHEAFYGCKSLRDVYIPNSVTTIGKRAFKCCDKLKSIEIPNSITLIAECLFDWCTNLNNVVIPKSVEKIDNWAFENCKNLKSITILNSGLLFGEDVFFGCDNLCSIFVPIGTKKRFERLLPKYKDKLIENGENLSTNYTDDDMRDAWCDEFGAIYSRDRKRLLKCPIIKAYSIKEGTKVIADRAFKGCTEIQDVIIPTSVELIGAQAFDSCRNLERIAIPHSVKLISEGCFDSCSSLQEIKIPEGITKIEDRTFEGCYKLHKILLPDSLLEIGSYAFSICSISELELPKHLTTIGYHAFWKASITKLVVPNSVNRIDAGAFWNCSSLESITLPPSISEIKEETFFFCTKLGLIKLPKSVKRIGRSAFDGAKSLKKVIVPEGVTRIEYAAFSTCSSLEEISLPNSVTYVGDKVFIDCPKLKKICVPTGAKEIFAKLIPNYMNKVYEK